MTSQLRKINNVIEQFLLPLAEAVSGWSTLAAIRSALIVTLPLMFLGSLAELMISFPLDAYKEFMFRQFGPEWRMFGQILKDASPFRDVPHHGFLHRPPSDGPVQP